ncbi:MAG: hypothetical protein JWN78_1201 [Bacteroidota bacterium]|nr:hypothetical protein [Bacteroidota bacterium]
MQFPFHIIDFISNAPWTFAKTMPEWPHEYVVRSKVDDALFAETVLHIREHGYLGYFYKIPMIYFDDDGLVYWTMGNPIEETTILNRCKKEDTYGERMKNV